MKAVILVVEAVIPYCGSCDTLSLEGCRIFLCNL